MKKIILDIDTGIDDALAITYLLAQKDVEVVGLTTVYGNVTIDETYRNTVDLVYALNKSDTVKVYKGESHPLNSSEYIVHEKSRLIHGQNGIGNVELFHAAQEESEMDAADFILDSVKKYGKDLTLVAVGPLTNVTRALLRDAETMKKIGKVVIMGGALTVPGNASIFAEANIQKDPEGAKIVFEADLPLVMVGLDVSHQTTFTGEDIAIWKSVDKPIAKGLYDMCVYYCTYEGNAEEAMVGCLHDPLAIEVALNPDVITMYYDCDLTVETEGPNAGRTIGRKDRIVGGPRTTSVPLRVDAAGFVRRFAETVLRFLEEL